MLLSMTGHGESYFESNEQNVTVEVRSVNNRYLKVNVRAGDTHASLEPRIETLVRELIRRGTIQVSVKIERSTSGKDYSLNEQILAGYHSQLVKWAETTGASLSVDLATLLTLPGVVENRTRDELNLEAEWIVLEPVIREALGRLTQMRAEEGTAMALDLRTNCQTIADQLDAVSARAPDVVHAYHSRLTERINQWLSDYKIEIKTVDIARDLGLIAERCDISEEIVRLQSHLEQFDSILNQPANNGRKLEFVIQEMFREANTIGSKANDSEISKYVIEMKSAIERMREMIQNAE